MYRNFTRRSRMVWEALVIALVLVAGSVSTMSAAQAHANGYTAMPSTPPTPGSTSNAPKPDFVVNASGTGQYARGATSNAYCNGHLYTGWTGADDHVNVAWGFNGSGFDHQVAYADTAYYDYNTNPTTYTRPVLACWTKTGDTARLWILFTGTNKNMYLGFLDPADEGHAFETVRTHFYNGQQHSQVGSETSLRSPALVTQGSTLRIGWVGRTNSYIYFESTNDGANFINKNIDSTNTADGGFGMTVWCVSGVCKLWIAFAGTDSSHHINVEYFNFNSGAWTNTAHPTADFTCHICDLTLVLQSGTLRIPYSGAGLYPDLNVDNSTNGYSWSNDQSQAGSIWGAGAAIDGGNHCWISFPVWDTLDPNNLQIVQFQYN